MNKEKLFQIWLIVVSAIVGLGGTALWEAHISNQKRIAEWTINQLIVEENKTDIVNIKIDIDELKKDINNLENSQIKNNNVNNDFIDIKAKVNTIEDNINNINTLNAVQDEKIKFIINRLNNRNYNVNNIDNMFYNYCSDNLIKIFLNDKKNKALH